MIENDSVQYAEGFCDEPGVIKAFIEIGKWQRWQKTADKNWVWDLITQQFFKIYSRGWQRWPFIMLHIWIESESENASMWCNEMFFMKRLC